MNKNISLQEENLTIDSLETLRIRQAEIKKQLNKSEDRLAGIWNDLFHSEPTKAVASPTQRAISFLTNSAGIIDGALLGWKLYRKFGSKKKSISKKKK